MIDKIMACKPDSIFDIIPEEMFAFDLGTDYAKSGNCWEWNFAVSRALNPKSYLEIGVRFGFSMVPAMVGAKELHWATGMDLETYGNISVAFDNVNKYYHGVDWNASWNIIHVDTQLLTELPEWHDLINIDGCHDYDCKMHDLRLTVGKCKWVLLDDYDYLIDVRRATDDFLKEVGSDGWGKKSIIDYAIYIPSFRGSMLIQYSGYDDV